MKRKTISLIRLTNLINRLRGGDTFYLSGDTPRISRLEVNTIKDFGLELQEDHDWGAQKGSPLSVYPLHPEIFKNKAEKVLKELWGKLK